MSIQTHIKKFYDQHPVPNPINLTLTEKQLVNGQKIDDLASEQNLRHFRNLLNTRLYKNAYKRHGKQLSMFVVRESDATHRHHLHLVIEQPKDIDLHFFMHMVKSCWQKTKFGYNEIHFEKPTDLIPSTFLWSYSTACLMHSILIYSCNFLCTITNHLCSVIRFYC